MTRTTVTLPEELDVFLQGAVRTESFSSKSEVVQHAIEWAFEDDHRRIAAALALFNENTLDAWEAFQLADVNDQELRVIIMDELDIGPEDTEVPADDILSEIIEDFTIELETEEQ